MSKRLAISLVAGLALAIFAYTPQAASQTSLGTVSVQGPQSCGNRQFDPPVLGGTPGMTCYAATLQCPLNDSLQFVYGVEVLPGITKPNGTIVFFSGGGGEHAADGPDQLSLIESYVTNGYQVVQIAWGPGMQMQDGLAWEDTNTSGGSNAASILNAACRPATFLNWVRNGNTGIGQGLWGGNGGMCAQGHSAGSAAIAYALAWYYAGAATAANGQGYLDKGIFTAGPVFSAIDRGCEVPNDESTFICLTSGQVGCSGWYFAQDPPGTTLEYFTGYKSEVDKWSGNSAVQNSPSCANNKNQQTTYDATWSGMSILYTGRTQQPSFNYTKTPISAWLCETTAPGVPGNNATSQGQALLGAIHQSVTSRRLPFSECRYGMPLHGGRPWRDRRRDRAHGISRYRGRHDRLRDRLQVEALTAQQLVAGAHGARRCCHGVCLLARAWHRDTCNIPS